MEKQIEQYDHKGKRLNNPQAGLVTQDSDPDTKEKKTYVYDMHLDPQLHWAGKAEQLSLEVPTVSLHVHERIDPRTIIQAAEKDASNAQQSLFEQHKPLREAIEFYKHKENWTNRLIAGDSLLIMNSLLEKEALSSKVQMVYIDPPYGIKYGSNFQPFINKRDVKDGKAEDLTTEPETIKAFRDTWELGIHSYLSYLRDRLLLAREMLTQSGSCFVQISDENVHLVRNIMDEVFGVENFVAQITFRTKNRPMNPKYLEQMCDFAIWYAKDKEQLKYNKLFLPKDIEGNTLWKYISFKDGTYRKLSQEEINNHQLLQKDFDKGGRIFRSVSIEPVGENISRTYEVEFEGKRYTPTSSWKYDEATIENMKVKKLLIAEGNSLRGKYFLDFYPIQALTIPWTDTNLGNIKSYVVQTANKVIERCILMTTDPGDLVFDPTCGSGTTAYMAEQWGRRWITCDTSRVATTLARQRLMCAVFDYYKLAHPAEGVSGGFEYHTVPHITLKSIANNEPTKEETLYDKPFRDTKRVRISSPFTVEAVPAPYVRSVDSLEEERKARDADSSIARSGETLRHTEWRDELLRTGVRVKNGKIAFSRVETHKGTAYIQAEAETREEKPKKVLVVFGPEHAPLEQRTVEQAYQEAKYFRPDILLFCAFKFDPEAAKEIDGLSPKTVGMQLLKAEMNADMLTEDLRKGSRGSESFWLVGQPEIKVHKLEDNTVQVEVLGFDYYNPRTGDLAAESSSKIALWMLDTDYDGRSLFPRQVFFPMAGGKDGWQRLARSLKANIDIEKTEAFSGTKSLPFTPGKTLAVKIVDDRGIESLKTLEV